MGAGLLDYYGIDWVATTVTFIAMYMLGSQRRSAFVVMSCANATWIVVGVLAGSVAIIIANAVIIGLNVRGWLKWKPPVPAPAGTS